MKDYEWKVDVKYSPDQPRVPAGDPQGGQFAPAGGGRSPFASGPEPRTFKTGHFVEQDEFDAVLEDRGQGSSPKPGVTREQLQRFYARRNAALEAAKTAYRGSRQTVAEHVDQAIADGYTKYSATSRWTTLTRPSDGKAYRYSGKVERDYINLALGRGDMKRNY